jgi:hypothetical protein
MNGAEELVIRIPLSRSSGGSFAIPELVGIKNGVTFWTQPFPKAEEINAAKSNAQCKGRRGGKGVVIDLASQYPADHGWIMQRFRWEGSHIRKLRDWIKQ